MFSEDDMRRVLVVLNVLVCIFSLCGFRPAPQASVANVAIINRSGQSTARITDGDMIRLQAVSYTHLTLPTSDLV